MAEKVILLYCN